MVVSTAVVAVGIISPYAILTLLLDGMKAAMIIGPLMLGGMALLPRRWFAIWPCRWRILVGCALGSGIGSLLVLLLGLAGWQDRRLWLGILIVAAVGGVVRLWFFSREETGPAPDVEWHEAPHSRAVRRLWLLLTPFLALSTLVPANAPGSIWREEGFGFDILEYHLQLPREYYQEGRITYRPHNVYANFPSNVEMLYLLSMIVLEDVHDVGVVANYVHWIFGCLAVLAAWAIGRDWSEHAGIVAAVSMGCANWLWYLSGLAYVELAMLFYGLVATGLVLRALQTDHRTIHMLVAGLVAGLACGCKYTSVPMIALPLLILFALRPCLARDEPAAGWSTIFKPASLKPLGAGILGVALTFGPWLGRNMVFTGNPVFPLADSVFPARPPGWSDDSANRWHQGHQAAPQQRSLPARFSALWTYVPGDHWQRFGPAIILLALAGMIGRRRYDADRFLLALLLIQVVVWLFATHLYARFAVVFLIPMSLLAGRAVLAPGRRRVVAVIGCLLGGAVWNVAYAVKLVQAEAPYGSSASEFCNGLYLGLEHFGVVNNELPADSKVLAVGEAKAFYFKRDVDYATVFNVHPLVAVIEESKDDRAVMNWLAREGYTHVLVNWSEIRRYAGSRYGFPAVVDEGLFSRLTALAGDRLVVRNEFAIPNIASRYVTIYEVVPPSEPRP
ncbi:MAG: hypothetical protein ACYTHJ_00130 [Planctomycetota bacterium]|jgi:hypothetical protein